MEHKNQTIRHATKWASITEISAKLVAPVSNMLLARLLTPEDFGVVATAVMIFSFAEMFTDSGFQKYLIQHEFKDTEAKDEAATVAFWANMSLSLIFWALISLFSEQLAVLVGSPGLGNVFIVTCSLLPITSFSSIQMALYKREFKFKGLFFARIISVLIPLVVTVPLAVLTRSYWAIIIGTICGHLSNAIVLTVKSSWKPKFYFSFDTFRKMISFSSWTLLESLLIWLTNYIGIFIVGVYLSTYYLGIYKTSMNTVNQIMNLIVSATTPVLFSVLAREQFSREKFENTFFGFQQKVGLLILPMGVGVFVYRDLITSILLGEQWGEAANFIGLWGLVNAVKIILSNYCSEAYRAVGKPRISVFVQLSQLLLLIPSLIYGAKEGYETLFVMRSLVSVELIVINLLTIQGTLKISAARMVKNVTPEMISSILMGGVAFWLEGLSSNVAWKFFSIILCAGCYFLILCLFPKRRMQMLKLQNRLFYKIGEITK